MQPEKDGSLPAGVTGGINVSLAQTSHGLGRKDDFFAKLAADAAQLGITDYALPTGCANASAEDGENARNYIAVPLRGLFDAAAYNVAAHSSSSASGLDRQAQELAERVTQEALKELVHPSAFLFVPPDEFAIVHRELQRLAEDLVRESQALAEKHARKLPLSDESLKRSLKRDLHARRFRDRHNAMFHYVNAANEAPETGIAPVATIDGQYGGIGAGHGRFVATLPQKRW